MSQGKSETTTTRPSPMVDLAGAENLVVVMAVRLSDYADEFDGEVSPEYLDSLWDAVANLKRARVRHAGVVTVL